MISHDALIPNFPRFRISACIIPFLTPIEEFFLYFSLVFFLEKQKQKHCLTNYSDTRGILKSSYLPTLLFARFHAILLPPSQIISCLWVGNTYMRTQLLFYLFFRKIHPNCSLPSLHFSHFPPLTSCLPQTHYSSVSLQKRAGFLMIINQTQHSKMQQS